MPGTVQRTALRCCAVMPFAAHGKISGLARTTAPVGAVTVCAWRRRTSIAAPPIAQATVATGGAGPGRTCPPVLSTAVETAVTAGVARTNPRTAAPRTARGTAATVAATWAKTRGPVRVTARTLDTAATASVEPTRTRGSARSIAVGSTPSVAISSALGANGTAALGIATRWGRRPKAGRMLLRSPPRCRVPGVPRRASSCPNRSPEP